MRRAVAGITKCAGQSIIADLETAGYAICTRSSRRVGNTIRLERSFWHPVQHWHLVARS